MEICCGVSFDLGDESTACEAKVAIILESSLKLSKIKTQGYTIKHIFHLKRNP